MENHEALQGLNTKSRGGSFSPVWTPEKPGEYIRGEYRGTNTFPTPDGGTAKGHIFALSSWAGSFVRSKTPVKLVAGEIVGCSGKLLDDALTVEDIGKEFVVIFEGYGPRKTKSRSPAKLFRVEEVMPAVTA